MLSVANLFYVEIYKMNIYWKVRNVNTKSGIAMFSPLNTKSRLLYLKTQFVPRSKHFSSRL